MALTVSAVYCSQNPVPETRKMMMLQPLPRELRSSASALLVEAFFSNPATFMFARVPRSA